jgi:prepilin-type N-terminal cleavage/methylation domain-containing protein
MALPERSGERGFTLMEMVVTLFILVVVIVGVLQLFDLASKVSRVQVDGADMQQTVRTAQYDMLRMLRMAGRGQVPAQSPEPGAGAWTWGLPNGVAVAVTNNVPANTFIDFPTSSDNPVLQDTDILTIRGVMTSPVYLPNRPSFVVNSIVPTDGNNGGTFTIPNTTAESTLPQDLQPIADAIEKGRPEALVLVSADDDGIRQIVKLDPAGSGVTRVGTTITQVTVQFRLGGDEYAQAYWALSGSRWDPALIDGKLGYVGIVEDYRYYIADQREDPADLTSPPKPRLQRARAYPGTARPWGVGPDAAINDADNWKVPMADNVADLQVALGIETGVGTPSTITDTGDNNDEWLFNSADDDPDTPAGPGGDPVWREGRLRFVRLNTTVFSERRDQSYAAPGFTDPDAMGPPADEVGAEDHRYNVPDFGTTAALIPDRMYRRRTLRTIVDLRNL